MNLFGDTLTFSNGTFLILALALALLFECVNGFHDTANAVATVIYTHSLRPWIAVIWSGIWNLIGVLTSSGAVAFAIVALLPVELVLNVGSAAGFSMVFSLLISAIIWNLGTWYLGLPTSSSHTLIGSIMGVGLANSLMTPGHVFGEGVNWGKTQEVFSSLLLSPVVGFVCSALLLLLARAFFSRQKTGKDLFVPADKNKTPPWWIRSLLILTCTGVSFAHGSNDGQKGMGLIVLILVGMLPGTFALNLSADTKSFQELVQNANDAGQILDQRSSGKFVSVQEGRDHLSDFLKTTGRPDERTWPAIATVNHELLQGIQGKSSFKDFSKDDRSKLRSDIYLIGEVINKLNRGHQITDAKEQAVLMQFRSSLRKMTDYIPTWVKVAVALALGCGTMVGWKRIVVTVGEKIGKTHLSYAQGASAEVVAMGTILAADHLGLPVSTTHVLSSGIAGTMAASGSGLQTATVRNLILAWVLTLPVCVFLGAAFFSSALYVIFNVLHMH